MTAGKILEGTEIAEQYTSEELNTIFLDILKKTEHISKGENILNYLTEKEKEVYLALTGKMEIEAFYRLGKMTKKEVIKNE